MATVRNRASVLCIRDNQVLALRHAHSPTESFWGVPGGMIEPGESPIAAALRETLEETGYRTELVHDPELVVEYDFLWNQRIVPCRTRWFAVQPIPDIKHHPHPGDEEFITGMSWFPVAQWALLFDGYPVLHNAIRTLVNQLNEKGLIQL